MTSVTSVADSAVGELCLGLLVGVEGALVVLAHRRRRAGSVRVSTCSCDQLLAEAGDVLVGRAAYVPEGVERREALLLAAPAEAACMPPIAAPGDRPRSDRPEKYTVVVAPGPVVACCDAWCHRPSRQSHPTQEHAPDAPFAPARCAAARRRPHGGVGAGVSMAAAPSTASRRVEVYAVSGPSTITLTGHGYGHGHGMSQYGAEGAARQGLTWQQIVEFYYPGTSWGELRGPISVLITADTTSDVQVARRSRGLKVTPARPARDAGRCRPTGRDAVAARRPAGGRTQVQFDAGRSAGARGRPSRGEAEFSRRREADHAGDARRDVDATAAGSARPSPRAGSARRATPSTSSAWSTTSAASYRCEIPALVEPRRGARAGGRRAHVRRVRSARTPTPRTTRSATPRSCQVYGGYDVEHPSADAGDRGHAHGRG